MQLIEETYCTFELAKKLKEVGFPQDSSYKGFILPWKEEFIPIDNDEIHNCYLYDEYIAAPTLSLVAKWLRKEKDIDINIDCEKGNTYTDYTVYMPEIADYLVDDDRPMLYGTYEEALSEGIDKALELLS